MKKDDLISKLAFETASASPKSYSLNPLVIIAVEIALKIILKKCYNINFNTAKEPNLIQKAFLHFYCRAAARQAIREQNSSGWMVADLSGVIYNALLTRGAKTNYTEFTAFMKDFNDAID